MDKNEVLIHRGTPQPYPGSPRGSGRYRKGSGENPYQHQMDFRSKVLKLRKEGLSDNEIMKKLSAESGYEIKSTEFRATMTVGKTAQREADRALALKLKEKGYSNVAIGERMGINESSVRGLLNDRLAENNNKIINTSNQLKKAVDEKGMIDIGKGVEREINVSEEHKKAAVSILKQEGYNVYDIYVKQATDPLGGKMTSQKILAKPDIPYKYVVQNMDQIGSLTMYSPDRGKTFGEVRYPQSIKSDRVKIRYNEEGGKLKDGVIELRPGVEDLSMRGNHYAQVRIAVDDSHFIKGMAIYGNPKDFPDGVDVIFNTNKHLGTDKMDVLKKFKTDGRTGEVDRINPFGSLLRANGQYEYEGADGKKHLSAINIVKQEGDWSSQAKTVASQMLSKQSLPLIKKQLGLSLAEYQSEFDDCKSLTNPSVKQKLLMSFGDKCDKAAAELKATAFPRQRNQVILPIDSLKDNEIYAPGYRDGETVALIRYPHAGTFEIPVLKVNNRNKEGSRVLGKDIQDAVGINTHVAGILSGADFDGDSVSVIPVNSRIKLRTSKPLDGLKDFEPKEAYPEVKGMKYLNDKAKQAEMGKISNLITDMTLKGADTDELVRAVKHSMVVIDAEKHKLNYQQSYIDQDIRQLKIKYQGVNANGQVKGASTLISQSKAETRVPKLSTRFTIDPETGVKTYLPDKKQTYIDKNGKEQQRTTTLPRTTALPYLYGTNDSNVLSTGLPVETVYAKYANSLKALGNEARREAKKITPIEKNPSAAKTYATQVDSLTSKLNQSLKNAPKERMAQRIANKNIDTTIQTFKRNPNVKDLEKEEVRKLRVQSIANARADVGAGKSKIKDITDKEWEAIQSGAISKTKLDQIINAMDEDKLKELALPKTTRTVSQAKINRAKAMAASGWTYQEIADSLGVSVSSVSKMLHP